MFVVTTTFSADPVVSSLAFLLDHVTSRTNAIQLFSYRALEQLLDAQSACLRNTSGINILLIRFQDFIEKDKENTIVGRKNFEILVKPHLETLLFALKQAVSTHSEMHWIICVCPETSVLWYDDPLYRRFISEQDNRFAESLQYEHVTYINPSSLFDAYPIQNYSNPETEALAGIPYQPLFFAALSAMISRTVYRLMSARAKVIALDCDDTLWQGVCAEDSVNVTPAHAFLQKQMLLQYESGTLLCLISKNNEDDVLAVLDQHPDMILRREHIIAHRINWKEKSDNLLSLAQTLGLSIDSFIFIDNDEQECAKMRTRCPSVITLQLPMTQDPIRQTLKHFWPLDARATTTTDRKRTLLYRVEQERKVEKKMMLDITPQITMGEYLQTTGLQVEIAPAHPETFERIAQLMTRTTQFNFSKDPQRPYTDMEIVQLLQSRSCMVAYAKDRFIKDPELMGLSIYTLTHDALRVSTFLMSCRFIGKNIEFEILDKLATVAETEAKVFIDLYFEPRRVTGTNQKSALRNKPALDFLENLVCRHKIENQDGIVFRISVIEARAALIRARKRSLMAVSSEQPKETSRVTPIETAPPTTEVKNVRWESEFFMYVQPAESLLQYVATKQTVTRPENIGLYVAPRDDLERSLIESLQPILAVRPIGVLDNFIQLGLDSTKAVQWIAQLKMMKQNIREMHWTSPTVLYEYTTIRILADFLRSKSTNATHEVLPPVLPALEKKDYYDLSYPQRGLWLVDQYNPHVSQYNVCMAWNLEGNLDIDALNRTYCALIERHEILRTLYQVVDEEPQQKVFSAQIVAFRIDYHDLRKWGADPLFSLSDYAERPYDLSRDWPLRVSLLQSHDHSYVLVLTLPHISIDGWSFNAIVEEQNILYADYYTKQSCSLSPVTLQYTDYSVWQRRYVNTQYLQPYLDVYSDTLKDAPMLILPTDRSRSFFSSYTPPGTAGRIPFQIDAAMVSLLKIFSAQYQVTMYTLLVAIFSVFLSKYSGQEDIVFASLFSGRHHEGLSSILGFFVNLIILRMNLSGNPCLSHLLQHTKKVIAQAALYQDVPFESLVGIFSGKRDQATLSQVVFSFQNYPVHTLSLPEVIVQSALRENDDILLSDYKNVKCDVMFCLQENDIGMRGLLEYNKAIFELHTMQRWVEHFQRLMKKILQQFEKPVGSIALLNKLEKQTILSSIQRNIVLYPHETLHRLFEKQVNRSPNAIALCVGGVGSSDYPLDCQLTYEQLNSLANRLAHFLQRHGVSSGQIIAVLGEPEHPEILISILAILKAGAAYAPMIPGIPHERLCAMLSGVAMVLCAHTGIPEGSGLEQVPVPIIILESMSDIDLFYQNERGENVMTHTQHTDLAYIIYTSGSTGVPKRVELEHRTIVNLVDWQFKRQKHATIQPKHIIQYSTFSFDVFTQEFFFALLSGYTLYVPTELVKKSMEHLIQYLLEHRIHQIFMPVIVLDILARAATPVYFPDLEEVIVAGEALRITSAIRELFARHPNAILCNQYGPSESHVVSECQLAGSVSEEWPALPDIGVPIQNTQLLVLDSYLQPVPIGVSGELYISGEGLARGYQRVDLTNEKFIIADPLGTNQLMRLYASGDIVYQAASGSLHYVGRRDGQVKRNGYRIELSDIESCLLKHPDIKHAVVLIVKQSGDDQQLSAYIVMSDDKIPNFLDIQDFLEEHLPPVMIPESFYQVSGLPLSKNGKLDKKALIEMQKVSAHDTCRSVTPHTIIEKKLIDIFCSIRGISSIGIHDDLFTRGLHSLGAFQVKYKIEQHFKINIAIFELLKARSIFKLGKVVEQKITDQKTFFDSASLHEICLFHCSQPPAATDKNTLEC